MNESPPDDAARKGIQWLNKAMAELKHEMWTMLGPDQHEALIKDYFKRSEPPFLFAGRPNELDAV